MKIPTPLRIAVLECDTPLPHILATYGTYGDIFSKLLHAGLKHLDVKPELQISKWDVVQQMEYPDLENVDAVLLTGSRHSAFDSNPWTNKLVTFTQRLLAQSRIRIVGVCYGHQIVGRALGVEVGRSNEGWETSVCDVELTALGKRLFGKEGLALHQMHRDVVFSYPPEVQALGSSPRCEVQGMYIARRVMTVQGHPEFDQEIQGELLEARHGQGIFDDATFEDGMGRVGKTHDGVVVAGAFLRFLLEEG